MTDRTLFLECHDWITERRTCHGTVAGRVSRAFNLVAALSLSTQASAAYENRPIASNVDTRITTGVALLSLAGNSAYLIEVHKTALQGEDRSLCTIARAHFI